ncbi:MAG TPA: YdcF family protein [Actinomycetota bacterium]|nr:YdcF family protein [Actinomycetota bacterium]
MAFVRRHPVFLGLVVLLALVVVLVLGTGVAVWQAAHRDEASRIDRADLVIVLGAAQYNGTPSPVFRARLDHAARMYRDGFSELILVVGGGQPGDVTTEGEAGRGYLVEDQVIPPEDVFASSEGRSTIESLRGARAFMDDRGLRSAFLVSDPWHNLRLLRMAGDLGIDGHVSATSSAARTQQTRLAGYVRETFAYLWYRLTGR